MTTTNEEAPDKRRAMLMMLDRLTDEILKGDVIGLGVAIVHPDGEIAFEIQTDDHIGIVAASSMLHFVAVRDLEARGKPRASRAEEKQGRGDS